jgi:hypothetical protein
LVGCGPWWVARVAVVGLLASEVFVPDCGCHGVTATREACDRRLGVVRCKRTGEGKVRDE